MADHGVPLRGKTITFLLPGGGGLPVGGYKVVYEYANGLAERGWRVRVVHVCIATREEMEAVRSTVFLRARRWLGYQRRRITGCYRPDRWFNISPKVELLCTKTPEARYIPASDFVVATAWLTGEWVTRYPDPKGIKVFFVQDYETYMTGSEVMQKRMRQVFSDSAFIKIGISPAVRAMIENCGSHMDAQIANGLDHSIYHLTCPIDSDVRNTIAFPVRSALLKGTEDAIKALERVRKKHPEIKVWAFGPRPHERLPDWLRFYLLPSDNDLRDLYNRTSIFVVASHYEGWGLPGSEAMACGAALASTDTGGVRAYADHGKTALLSPPKNPDALAENILRLLENRELRLRLAHQGHSHIQQFTWDRAVTSFESVLQDALAQARNEPAPLRHPREGSASVLVAGFAEDSRAAVSHPIR